LKYKFLNNDIITRNIIIRMWFVGEFFISYFIFEGDRGDMDKEKMIFQDLTLFPRKASIS